MILSKHWHFLYHYFLEIKLNKAGANNTLYSLLPAIFSGLIPSSFWTLTILLTGVRLFQLVGNFVVFSKDITSTNLRYVTASKIILLNFFLCFNMLTIYFLKFWPERGGWRENLKKVVLDLAFHKLCFTHKLELPFKFEIFLFQLLVFFLLNS